MGIEDRGRLALGGPEDDPEAAKAAREAREARVRAEREKEEKEQAQHRFLAGCRAALKRAEDEEPDWGLCAESAQSCAEQAAHGVREKVIYDAALVKQAVDLQNRAYERQAAALVNLSRDSRDLA